MREKATDTDSPASPTSSCFVDLFLRPLRFSTEPVSMSAYNGSSKNLKDIKDLNELTDLKDLKDKVLARGVETLHRKGG